MSVTGEERFKGGSLVGSYNGIARDGELITIEASGVSSEGFYVILQKDNDGLDEDQWHLHVGDFAAFGEYTAKITGCTYHTILTKKYWGTHIVVKIYLDNSDHNAFIFQMSIWFPTLLPCQPNMNITRLQDASTG